MSHEEARQICRNDEGCVAYTYAMDSMTNPNVDNVIIYSTKLCTYNCDVTTWKDDLSLITQVNPSSHWNTAKCYLKRSHQDYYLDKCNQPR